VVQERESNDSAVIVIGAGSTGSSTAFHIAKSGEKVILIDGGQVASGTTSKSTALVRTHYSNEIVAKMALYSLRIFENFPESGFVNNGMLILSSGAEREGLRANTEMLSRIGVRNEVLSRTEALSRFPILNTEDCEYILLEPESGYADPVGTATAYVAKARELGATVLLGQSVKKLAVEDKHVTGVVLSDDTKLHAKRVILCTNVWTNKLLSNSGLADELILPLWAVAHPVVVFRRPENYLGRNHPSIADLPNKTYYKPEGKSFFFAGSLDAELDSQHTDPDFPPTEVPFEMLNFFSQTVSKRIPAMSEGLFQSAYIGMYDMTPDQHPIIDDLGQLGFEGAYCCVGLSGHGFKLCPALGLMNAEMVLGKKLGDSPGFDRSYFSLSRFKRGELLLTKYAGIGTIA
jgi:sarcosine oxidase, subunit beta